MFVVHGTQYTASVYAIPTLVTAVATLLLGLVVLFREHGSRVSILFGLVTLTIGAWLVAFSFMYCAVEEGVALWWARTAYLAVPFIPSAIYHFTVAVLRLPSRCRRFAKISWGLSTLFALAILGTDAFIEGVYWYWWGPYPRYGPLSVSFLIFFFGTMVLNLREYWRESRKAEPGTTHKRRVKTLFIAFAIAYLGSFDYLAKYGIPLYPFGYLPVFGFLILAAGVIWRYRLVDLTPSFAASHILETMQGSLFVGDLDGRLQVINRAALEMLGYQELEVRDRPLADVVRAPIDVKLNGEVVTGERTVRDHLMVWHAKDGRAIDVMVSASLVRDQDHHPAGIVYVALDITERKRSEEQLRQANEELTRSQRVLLEVYEDLERSLAELKQTQLQLIEAVKMETVGRLAAGVAHEVKNPLATILMGIEYLTRHLPPDGNNRGLVLQDMRHAVKRADAVVRGLLDFSTSKSLELNVEDVHAVIEQALALVNIQLTKFHITVVKQLAAELPPVRVDRQKMEQVFVNLFLNAIQAMPDGGALTVRTASQELAHSSPEAGSRIGSPFHFGETVVIVEIDDSGTVLPKDKLSKVFDPFFTTKPTGQGTGLGLTVTRNIIELHGGAIEVRNRAEGGVRATVTLKI